MTQENWPDRSKFNDLDRRTPYLVTKIFSKANGNRAKHKPYNILKYIWRSWNIIESECGKQCKNSRHNVEVSSLKCAKESTLLSKTVECSSHVVIFFPIVLFIEKQLLARRSNEDVSLDSPFLLIQGIFFLRPIIIWLCCFWHPYATVLENEAFKLLGCHNTMRRAVEVIRSLIDAIHFTFSACSLSCLRHDLFFSNSIVVSVV